MVEMASKKLPPEVIEWFRKMGAKGGKKGGSAGGKAAAANMTANERKARAKNAVAVREAKRRSKTKKAGKLPFSLSAAWHYPDVITTVIGQLRRKVLEGPLPPPMPLFSDHRFQ